MIIKDGIIPSYIIRFNCEYCGCIFEADKSEYQCSTQMEVMHDGLAPYKCQCPRCKRIVYGERTIK